MSLMRCKCRMENSTRRIVQKFSIRRIERIDQIDKLPPGSQNIVEYFQVSLMRCKCRMKHSNRRIVQKILYSPNRTNRSNRQASTRVPEYRGIKVSLMRCKCRIEDSTCRIVQNISICQIERIGLRKLLFLR